MERMETNLKLTKAQAKKLSDFCDVINEDYKRGFYSFVVSMCKRECSRDPLYSSMFAGAFGWFLNFNIPFAVIYQLVVCLADKILEKEGFLTR